MAAELSPFEIALRRYATVVVSRHSDVPTTVTSTVRVFSFLGVHEHAWRLACGDVEAERSGWPYGDDQAALEGKLLEFGINVALEGVPNVTERLCGAMLERFLDWLASPDDQNPYITPLTRTVGSTLYRALPGSADALPRLSLPPVAEEGTPDPDSTEFEFEDEAAGVSGSEEVAAESPDPLWSSSSMVARGVRDSRGPQEPNLPVDPHANEAASTSSPPSATYTEADEIAGLRPFPAFGSAPTTLLSTAGAFYPTDWETYLDRAAERAVNGTWVLNRYPIEGKTLLQFMGDHFSAFAEISQEDIRSARVAAKGLNFAIEVQAVDGQQFVVVGPRKRLRSIFEQLGFSL